MTDHLAECFLVGTQADLGPAIELTAQTDDITETERPRVMTSQHSQSWLLWHAHLIVIRLDTLGQLAMTDLELWVENITPRPPPGARPRYVEGSDAVGARLPRPAQDQTPVRLLCPGVGRGSVATPAPTPSRPEPRNPSPPSVAPRTEWQRGLGCDRWNVSRWFWSACAQGQWQEQPRSEPRLSVVNVARRWGPGWCRCFIGSMISIPSLGC
jgi:hypothetical protein